jgi:hypothetical protein
MEQLLYNTLAFLILATAIILAGRKVYASFFVKKESSCASGCDGCSSNCELKCVIEQRNTTL